MAMNHCLEAGGKHVEPGHFKLMMAGAEMCQTAANQIVIGMRQYQHTCREGAEECAQSEVAPFAWTGWRRR